MKMSGQSGSGNDTRVRLSHLARLTVDSIVESLVDLRAPSRALQTAQARRNGLLEWSEKSINLLKQLYIVSSCVSEENETTKGLREEIKRASSALQVQKTNMDAFQSRLNFIGTFQRLVAFSVGPKLDVERAYTLLTKNAFDELSLDQDHKSGRMHAVVQDKTRLMLMNALLDGMTLMELVPYFVIAEKNRVQFMSKEGAEGPMIPSPLSTQVQLISQLYRNLLNRLSLCEIPSKSNGVSLTLHKDNGTLTMEYGRLYKVELCLLTQKPREPFFVLDVHIPNLETDDVEGAAGISRSKTSSSYLDREQKKRLCLLLQERLYYLITHFDKDSFIDAIDRAEGSKPSGTAATGGSIHIPSPSHQGAAVPPVQVVAVPASEKEGTSKRGVTDETPIGPTFACRDPSLTFLHSFLATLVLDLSLERLHVQVHRKSTQKPSIEYAVPTSVPAFASNTSSPLSYPFTIQRFPAYNTSTLRSRYYTQQRTMLLGAWTSLSLYLTPELFSTPSLISIQTIRKVPGAEGKQPSEVVDKVTNVPAIVGHSFSSGGRAAIGSTVSEQQISQWRRQQHTASLIEGMLQWITETKRQLHRVATLDLGMGTQIATESVGSILQPSFFEMEPFQQYQLLVEEHGNLLPFPVPSSQFLVQGLYKQLCAATSNGVDAFRKWKAQLQAALANAPVPTNPSRLPLGRPGHGDFTASDLANVDADQEEIVTRLVASTRPSTRMLVVDNSWHSLFAPTSCPASIADSSKDQSNKEPASPLPPPLYMIQPRLPVHEPSVTQINDSPVVLASASPLFHQLIKRYEEARREFERDKAIAKDMVRAHPQLPLDHPTIQMLPRPKYESPPDSIDLFPPTRPSLPAVLLHLLSPLIAGGGTDYSTIFAGAFHGPMVLAEVSDTVHPSAKKLESISTALDVIWMREAKVNTFLLLQKEWNNFHKKAQALDKTSETPEANALALTSTASQTDGKIDKLAHEPADDVEMVAPSAPLPLTPVQIDLKNPFLDPLVQSVVNPHTSPTSNAYFRKRTLFWKPLGLNLPVISSLSPPIGCGTEQGHAHWETLQTVQNQLYYHRCPWKSIQDSYLVPSQPDEALVRHVLDSATVNVINSLFSLIQLLLYTRTDLFRALNQPSPSLRLVKEELPDTKSAVFPKIWAQPRLDQMSPRAVPQSVDASAGSMDMQELCVEVRIPPFESVVLVVRIDPYTGVPSLRLQPNGVTSAPALGIDTQTVHPTIPSHVLESPIVAAAIKALNVSLSNSVASRVRVLQQVIQEQDAKNSRHLWDALVAHGLGISTTAAKSTSTSTSTPTTTTTHSPFASSPFPGASTPVTSVHPSPLPSPASHTPTPTSASPATRIRIVPPPPEYQSCVPNHTGCFTAWDLTSTQLLAQLDLMALSDAKGRSLTPPPFLSHQLGGAASKGPSPMEEDTSLSDGSPAPSWPSLSTLLSSLAARAISTASAAAAESGASNSVAGADADSEDRGPLNMALKQFTTRAGEASESRGRLSSAIADGDDKVLLAVWIYFLQHELELLALLFHSDSINAESLQALVQTLKKFAYGIPWEDCVESLPAHQKAAVQVFGDFFRPMRLPRQTAGSPIESSSSSGAGEECTSTTFASAHNPASNRLHCLELLLSVVPSILQNCNPAEVLHSMRSSLVPLHSLRSLISDRNPTYLGASPIPDAKFGYPAHQGQGSNPYTSSDSSFVQSVVGWMKSQTANSSTKCYTSLSSCTNSLVTAKVHIAMAVSIAESIVLSVETLKSSITTVLQQAIWEDILLSIYSHVPSPFSPPSNWAFVPKPFDIQSSHSSFSKPRFALAGTTVLMDLSSPSPTCSPLVSRIGTPSSLYFWISSPSLWTKSTLGSQIIALSHASASVSNGANTPVQSNGIGKDGASTPASTSGRVSPPPALLPSSTSPLLRNPITYFLTTGPKVDASVVKSEKNPLTDTKCFTKLAIAVPLPPLVQLDQLRNKALAEPPATGFEKLSSHATGAIASLVTFHSVATMDGQQFPTSCSVEVTLPPGVPVLVPPALMATLFSLLSISNSFASGSVPNSPASFWPFDKQMESMVLRSLLLPPSYYAPSDLNPIDYVSTPLAMEELSQLQANVGIFVQNAAEMHSALRDKMWILPLSSFEPLIAAHFHALQSTRIAKEILHTAPHSSSSTTSVDSPSSSSASIPQLQVLQALIYSLSYIGSKFGAKSISIIQPISPPAPPVPTTTTAAATSSAWQSVIQPGSTDIGSFPFTDVFTPCVSIPFVYTSSRAHHSTNRSTASTTPAKASIAGCAVTFITGSLARSIARYTPPLHLPSALNKAIPQPYSIYTDPSATQAPVQPAKERFVSRRPSLFTAGTRKVITIGGSANDAKQPSHLSISWTVLNPSQVAFPYSPATSPTLSPAQSRAPSPPLSAPPSPQVANTSSTTTASPRDSKQTSDWAADIPAPPTYRLLAVLYGGLFGQRYLTLQQLCFVLEKLRQNGQGVPRGRDFPLDEPEKKRQRTLFDADGVGNDKLQNLQLFLSKIRNATELAIGWAFSSR